MKDSYSFDIDAEGLDVSFQQTLRRVSPSIFARCGLDVIPVEAHFPGFDGRQSVRGIYGGVGRR